MANQEHVDTDLAEGIAVGYLEQMDKSEVHPATAIYAAFKIVALLCVHLGVTDAIAIRQLRETLKQNRERFKTP
jgi:hypothetical protein